MRCCRASEVRCLRVKRGATGTVVSSVAPTAAAPLGRELGMCPTVARVLVAILDHSEAKRVRKPRRHEAPMAPGRIGGRPFEAKQGGNPALRELSQIADHLTRVESMQLRHVEAAERGRGDRSEPRPWRHSGR
jgi:hypothetical protein